MCLIVTSQTLRMRLYVRTDARTTEWEGKARQILVIMSIIASLSWPLQAQIKGYEAMLICMRWVTRVACISVSLIRNIAAILVKPWKRDEREKGRRGGGRALHKPQVI